MHRMPPHVRLLACLAALAAFLVSVGTAAAVAQDFVTRETLPPGSAVADAEIGGIRVDQAREALRSRVLASLEQTVAVVAGQQAAQIRPSQFVRLDLDGMLDRLAAAKADAGLGRRLIAGITREPYGRRLPVQARIDRAALDAWVRDFAAHVGAPAADATMVVQGRELVAVPERPGISIDPRRAADALAVALMSGQERVELPIQRIEPAVAVEDLGPAILVRRADRRLLLYDDGRLVKVYRVAVGAPGYPTPRGRWRIVRKRYMPTWGNPGSDWAKGMPRFIPPGPNNPLGTRALDLDAPGIRIHGTNKDYSIGTAASHGCMRMHRWDIEDLYERVPVGTPVIIID